VSFPRYPAYRDSGVEWIGEVPAHWNIDRLKRSVRSERNGIWGGEPQGNTDDLPCLRVADFDRNRLVAKTDNLTIRNISAKEREGRLLGYNDLLIEKSGGGENQPVGCVVLFAESLEAVCSNFVARLELFQGMDPSYWRYLHAATYAARINTRSIKQTSGIQNLDTQAYFDERSPFPSHEEQAGIGSFLDRETAKIDALIAEQERLIALLQEKRQVVISHAVTKGLDPNVPMKESGVEWIGHIPAHWRIVPLKQLATMRTGIAKGKEYFEEELIDIPYLRVANVQDGFLDLSEVHLLRIPVRDVARFALQAGDVLMNEGGDFDKLGRGTVWHGQISPCVTQNHVFAVRPLAVDSGWLAEYTGSAAAQFYFMSRSKQSTNLASISSRSIMELPVPLPPSAEVADILRALQATRNSCLRLIEDAQRTAALLRERRSALITAAVTGQIDVRGLVETAA
jgi:type I restriction enzyme S subunit